MKQTSSDELPINEEPYDSSAKSSEESQPYGLRNFLLIAMQQVMFRVAWIFKTETIIIPAFMVFIGASPLQRSILPVLNRIGFSLPVLFARRLKNMPRKKWALAACSFGMAFPFAILAAILSTNVWRDEEVARVGVSGEVVSQAAAWFPWFFLFLYGIFFAVTGLNQLAAHTVQGKLIQAQRRGRLMAISVMVGVPLAVAAAWFLLRRFLEMEDFGFNWIFAVSSLIFVLGTLVVFGLVESPDAHYEEAAASPLTYFGDAWRALRNDPHFTQLSIVIFLYGTMFMLFPHYIPMATEHFGLEFVKVTEVVAGEGEVGLKITELVSWVCIQNIGTAVFSIVLGLMADKLGNRLAMRIAILGSALAPLLAAGLMFLGPEIGGRYFWTVFVLLAFVPVTMRLIANYTLELARCEDHPRYVSTIGLCIAAPVIVGALLVGLLVEVIGYQWLFIGGSCLVLLAALQTFRIIEPRHNGSHSTNE